MADFEVAGSEDFLALSKALKAAGRTAMRRELNRNLQGAVKPLIPLTRSAALSSLPSRGGLAALVAKEPQRVQVRTGQDTAGVRLVVGRSSGGARATNRGLVRHPVFFHPPKVPHYVTQKVRPGWFDRTVQAHGGDFQRAVLSAMDTVVDEIVKGA